MGQYVAIDLHKPRSLIVRADEQGERLETIRIGPVRRFVSAVMKCSPENGPDTAGTQELSGYLMTALNRHRGCRRRRSAVLASRVRVGRFQELPHPIKRRAHGIGVTSERGHLLRVVPVGDQRIDDQDA